MAFLDIQGVRKLFGQSVAVDTFNLSVDRGEFVSFLGPSGCGKTTMLRIVAGFEAASAGTVHMDGVDMTHAPANRRNIGMVFQSYALFPNMTVADNIGFGLKIAGMPAAALRERVDDMLRIIHMAEFSRRYPYQLSGGQQQRVALARALAIRPKLLLLDEPLSALDAKIRAALRQEIREIQRQLGITTIFVTHDQEEAMALSDRVVVMSQGRIEQIGTPFEVYNFPRTHFVASFVGTLNVLPATVVSAAAGRLRLDGHEIRVARQLAEHRDGSTVGVAIRPELITLDAGADTSTNTIRGTVADVVFLGAVVRVRLRFAEHLLHVDMFNNPQLRPPAAGASVTAHFAPDSCLVLDHSSPVA